MLERDDEVFGGRAKNGVVVAACRDPANAHELQALKAKHGDRVRVVKVDVTDEATITEAMKVVTEELGRLDFMANVSAVLSTETMRPETSIARCEVDNMMLSYRTNAVGPTMMMKHFSPLMLKTAALYAAEGKSGAPVIANWSARVSSVGDNELGGWHSYRGSKTALNQLTRNAAIEFSRKKTPIIAMLIHPGTVDTKLSEPFKKNVPPEKLFTPEYSVKRMLEVIGGATLETHSGYLFDYAGEKIDW
jgi:NAD(P)-dependent dehydrogenase (short-subunit alcohol dehydrogenase family)